MKYLILIFLVCSLNSANAQKELEIAFCNTISVARMYESNFSREYKSPDGGNTFDINRFSFLLNYNKSIFEKTFVSMGFSYASNTYYFIGNDYFFQGISLNDEILQKYNSVSPFFGIKTKWGEQNTKFYIGINIFPEFIVKQSGYYYLNSLFKEIEPNRTGLSQINSRVNMSIQFGKSTKQNFTFNWFIQPPCIYVGNVIEHKITYINTGFSLGWIFNLLN